MGVTSYIFTLCATISLFYVWVHYWINKENRKNIEEYKPVIFPVTKFNVLAREIYSVFGLSLMTSIFVYAVFDNVIVFVLIGIIAMVLILFIVHNRVIIVYFLEDKIILWSPSLIQSNFSEIIIDDVEALIFEGKDEVLSRLSNMQYGNRCSINVSIENHKRSFTVNLEKYSHQKLMDYFNKHGKPIYTKVHYERTARRIN